MPAYLHPQIPLGSHLGFLIKIKNLLHLVGNAVTVTAKTFFYFIPDHNA